MNNKKIYLIYMNNLNNNFINNFYNNFYNKINNYGFHKCLSIFDKYSKCQYNNIEFNTPYDYLLFLTENEIKKFNYFNCNMNFQYINFDTYLINTHGTIQAIKFNNNISNILRFSEAIIIKNNLIENYIININ
jgi:hypothetical protein